MIPLTMDTKQLEKRRGKSGEGKNRGGWANSLRWALKKRMSLRNLAQRNSKCWTIKTRTTKRPKTARQEEEVEKSAFLVQYQMMYIWEPSGRKYTVRARIALRSLPRQHLEARSTARLSSLQPIGSNQLLEKLQKFISRRFSLFACLLLYGLLIGSQGHLSTIHLHTNIDFLSIHPIQSIIYEMVKNKLRETAAKRSKCRTKKTRYVKRINNTRRLTIFILYRHN